MEKDKINELYSALETLNKEKQQILDSPEYNIGLAYKRYTGFLKKLDFVGLFKALKDLHNGNKVLKYYTNKTQVDENNIKKDAKINKNTKIAVFTCVIGDYDNIHKPLVKLDNVDYILFVDNYEKYKQYEDVYKVIKLDDNILKLGPTLGNRYAKLHPHSLLKDYDFSIYIDGNVRVVSNISYLVNYCNKKTGLAMYRHSLRNCIYVEAEVCKLLNRGNKKFIDKQIKEYENEGFPKDFGMNEATIIVSDLNNLNSTKYLNLWWDELVRSGSNRDQLAWPYVLWKNNLTIDDVGCLGFNEYDNYAFEFNIHI